jgi:hypothetical protein
VEVVDSAHALQALRAVATLECTGFWILCRRDAGVTIA